MTKKNPGERKKPGAKSSYDEKRHPRIVLSLSRKGKTFEEIAPALGIVPRTLTEWRKKYPAIDQALSNGRAVAVAELEESTYNRAKGVTTREKRIIQVPDGIGEDGKPRYKIQRVELIEKEYPPDPGAAKLLLNAWEPETYVDAMKLTGDPKNPVEVTHDISPEAATLLKQLYRTGTF